VDRRVKGEWGRGGGKTGRENVFVERRGGGGKFSKLTSKKGLLALKHTFYPLVICEISASMLKIQLGKILSSPASTSCRQYPSSQIG